MVTMQQYLKQIECYLVMCRYVLMLAEIKQALVELCIYQDFDLTCKYHTQTYEPQQYDILKAQQQYQLKNHVVYIKYAINRSVEIY